MRHYSKKNFDFFEEPESLSYLILELMYGTYVNRTKPPMLVYIPFALSNVGIHTFLLLCSYK